MFYLHPDVVISWLGEFVRERDQIVFGRKAACDIEGFSVRSHIPFALHKDLLAGHGDGAEGMDVCEHGTIFMTQDRMGLHSQVRLERCGFALTIDHAKLQGLFLAYSEQRFWFSFHNEISGQRAGLPIRYLCTVCVP